MYCVIPYSVGLNEFGGFQGVGPENVRRSGLLVQAYRDPGMPEGLQLRHRHPAVLGLFSIHMQRILSHQKPNRARHLLPPRCAQGSLDAVNRPLLLRERNSLLTRQLLQGRCYWPMSPSPEHGPAIVPSGPHLVRCRPPRDGQAFRMTGAILSQPVSLYGMENLGTHPTLFFAGERRSRGGESCRFRTPYFFLKAARSSMGDFERLPNTM